MEDKLLTVKGAAGFLGVSPPTIYRWVDAKKIPYIKNGYYLRFSRNALVQWLKDNTHAPDQEN